MVKMPKQKIAVLLCLLFAISAAPLAFAEEEPAITVWLDGEMLSFDTQPIMESDRTLVPMRTIFEALGAEVSWDADTSTAIAVKDDVQIEISIDNPIMRKNGQEILLDVPARLVGQRTLVPVRAISESFGATVEWQEDTWQVIITSAPQQSEQMPDVQPSEQPLAEQVPPSGTETEGNSFQELSAEDMQTLKDSYNNLIRYNFEQYNLPAAVLNESIAAKIAKKSVEAENLAYDVWNTTVIGQIMQIQAASDTNYIVDAVDGIDLKEGYMKIVEEAGLEAHEFFDVTFETLSDDSVMMLVTFNETDTLVACKYIGVVVGPDQSIRYFTAETAVLYQDALFFCEVTMEGRGTIGLIGFEKDDFIEAANMELSENLSI